MEREAELIEMVKRGFTQREIAKRWKVGQCSVRYWLRKYGLRTRYEQHRRDAPRNTECAVCGKSMGENKRNLKKCGSCMTAIRRFLTKQKAIGLLGGKCKRCGYSQHPAALEFHHLGGKDFTIGAVANKSWKVIVAEVKKCELLCANCHRVEHSKRTANFVAVAARHYNGKFIGQLAETV